MMKKRRKPHGLIPEEIANHGFVSDMNHEMSLLAKRFGVQVHKFKKNDDWFLAIRIPDPEELAQIDRENC